MIGAKRAITLCLQNAPIPVAAVSPTFPIARKTTVPMIEYFLAGKARNIGPEFQYRYNKSLHYFSISYHGRTGTIYILSGDDPNSLRGPNLAAAWLDEPFLMEKAVFDQMMARVRAPEAALMELDLTGTPEGLGDWGYDLCVGEMKDELKEYGDIDVGLVQASTRANLALSASYARRLEGTLTEKQALAYVEGQFVSMTEGLVFYGFSALEADPELSNVRDLPVPREADLGCGLDFNVNPLAGAVFWQAGGHLHFFDEIELPNADTEFMCQELAERYVHDETRRTPQVLQAVYPDATGSARKTAAPAGKTDFHYIRDAGFTICAGHENPKVRDSYVAVNAKLRPKVGKPTLTVSPKCKKLIKYLSTYSYEKLNKQEAMSHLLSSLRYPVTHLFPVTRDTARQMRLTGL